jgi:two-component system sensor histidine kinase EvgS
MIVNSRSCRPVTLAARNAGVHGRSRLICAAKGTNVMMPSTPPSAARPRNILLVDDEVNQLVILQSGLAKLPNCEITVATSGRQALSLCTQQNFDLLITDYHMPEMDGLTLATAVYQQYPWTQIIMLTAYASEILDEQTDGGPVRLVLEKPIDINHIRSAALQLMDRSTVSNDRKWKSPGRY